MHCIIDTTTELTALELQKWLKGVDKIGLLNLLWVSYCNRTPITVLVIKKLLRLVHDGFLWLEEPIPITNRLIHRITRLPYTGENMPMMFGEKGGKQALEEAMKEKLKLVKKPRGYAISSISDPVVKVATQILVGKVMRKCCKDELLAPGIALVAQCTEGVQFNWVHYLCDEFLMNYREAQELRKTFQYAWLLMSIVMVAWELPKDSQLPSVAPNLPEAA